MHHPGSDTVHPYIKIENSVRISIQQKLTLKSATIGLNAVSSKQRSYRYWYMDALLGH